LHNLKIHKNFQLNEEHFSSIEELLSFSESISENVFLFLSNWFSADDYIDVQTSGSTGAPKIIRLKKEWMLNSALATGVFFNLREHTKALLCLPIGYIAGKMMLVRALVLGWEIDIIEPTAKPLKKIVKFYDFSAMIPMQLQNSLEQLHIIKKVIVGGAPVSVLLQDKLQNHTTEVFATYGMTETVTHIAIKKLNNFLGNTEKTFYKIVPDVKISHDNRNCLVIDAPKVSNDIMTTNDVVRMVSNSEFEWLGRIDHVINSGGIKLHPKQIEDKMSLCITKRFFVAGIPDNLLGEKLVLVIEGAEDQFIRNQVHNLKTLLKFEFPKEIYFIENFIETETKKIQRTKTLSKIFH